MPSENKIYSYEPLWGSWYIDELIGEGSFGKVYKIHRDEYGQRYYSAVKLISIPRSETEYSEFAAGGMNIETIRDYYRGYVRSIVEEMHLMQRLRGNSNIVSYEDHSVVEDPYGVGADILARMELLTPLNEIIATRGMRAGDILRMGIDICKALEVCQHFNIIHRDIKPGNIFISESGSYKLGDFGIARHINNNADELSKKGTFPYMAPEVYRGAAYDTSIDLYSLGIVMYRLLNNNRLPFLPQPPSGVSYSENEQAVSRRLAGEPMPPPANAPQGRLTDVVMKACSFFPQSRYHSPAQMREELEDTLLLLTDYTVLNPGGNIAPPPSNVPFPEIKSVPIQSIHNETEPGHDNHDENNAPYTPFRVRREAQNKRNSAFYIALESFKNTTLGMRMFNIPNYLKGWISEKFPTRQEKRQILTIIIATAAAALVIFLTVMFSLGGFGSPYKDATDANIIGTWEQSRGELVYTFTSNGSVETSEGKWQTDVGVYYVQNGNELIIKSAESERTFEIRLYKNGKKIDLTDAYGKKITLKKE